MNIATAEVISSIGTIPILSFFNKTPRYTLLCGCCRTSFKKSFSIAECEDRPRTFCPNCNSLNEVPIWWDREEREIRLDYEEEEW